MHIYKPTGKRPLGRPRRRWEDNIRMNLEQIGVNAGNWVDSSQDRDYWRSLVNAALKLRKFFFQLAEGLSLSVWHHQHLPWSLSDREVVVAFGSAG